MLWLWPAQVDFPSARDCSNEGRSEPAAEVPHLGQGNFECTGHILAGHVSRRENKLADGVLLECSFFEEAVADSLIRR